MPSHPIGQAPVAWDERQSIPTSKRKADLGCTIESVLSDTLVFELIVVDGSPQHADAMWALFWLLLAAPGSTPFACRLLVQPLLSTLVSTRLAVRSPPLWTTNVQLHSGFGEAPLPQSRTSCEAETCRFVGHPRRNWRPRCDVCGYGTREQFEAPTLSGSRP